jgi:selenide,water dikinase
MRTRRFIDYAKHGGCSAKLDAPRLRRLLEPLPGGVPGFADAGVAETAGHRFASSVDVVLPMIDDPTVFGQIVVVHVLSDLYAVGAEPVFALNVLAVPKVPEEDEDGNRIPDGLRRAGEAAIDADVQTMLLAADSALEGKGIARVGGHSLLLDGLIFGLAATGVLPAGGGVSNDSAQPGDLLVLTKPVGTSIATKSWKGDEAERKDFEDVVQGMLRSNESASAAMSGLQRCACTDVTGFGLMGHLHNMLLASGVAATVDFRSVPVYESVRSAMPSIEPGHNTRIYDSNRDFVIESVHNLYALTEWDKLLFFDAQISGGLLLAISPGETDGYLAALAAGGDEGWVIGEVVTGTPGEITIE